MGPVKPVIIDRLECNCCFKPSKIFWLRLWGTRRCKTCLWVQYFTRRLTRRFLPVYSYGPPDTQAMICTLKERLVTSCSCYSTWNSFITSSSKTGKRSIADAEGASNSFLLLKYTISNWDPSLSLSALRIYKCSGVTDQSIRTSLAWPCQSGCLCPAFKLKNHFEYFCGAH